MSFEKNLATLKTEKFAKKFAQNPKKFAKMAGRNCQRFRENV